MQKQKMNVAKGVLGGMAVGGVAGIALAMAVRKPARRGIRRRAASAMDTVGAIMQSVADLTR